MIPTAQPKTGATSAPPATASKYVVLDVETGHASREVVKRAQDRWNPPANIKDPEKIEERRKEAHETIKERDALLDGAPVICVACRTESEGQAFNGMDQDAHEISGVKAVPCGDERGMLVALRDWLDRVTGPETVLVGFNVKAFDLPKLRARFVHHRLRLPLVLFPRPYDEKQPVVDVMKLYLGYFTPENGDKYMIGLEAVIDALGLPQYKKRVNGAQIPELHKKGKHKEVLTYCALDVVATWSAYLLLTSQANELK